MIWYGWLCACVLDGRQKYDYTNIEWMQQHSISIIIKNDMQPLYYTVKTPWNSIKDVCVCVCEKNNEYVTWYTTPSEEEEKKTIVSTTTTVLYKSAVALWSYRFENILTIMDCIGLLVVRSFRVYSIEFFSSSITQLSHTLFYIWTNKQIFFTSFIPFIFIY